MVDLLTLGPDGWLRDGRNWTPDAPFYGVMGDPIDHSLSPVMQSAALTEREIDAEYLPIRISTGQLRQLKGSPAAQRLAGFNVTAPLKEAVAELCDGRTDQARDLGAVNTVRVEGERWLGHNTDSGGILTVLSEAWSAEEPPRRAIVLGAGGSARAAVDALLRWEVPAVEVRNRSEAGRRRFAQWLDQRGVAERVQVEGLTADGALADERPTVWVCCLAGGVVATPFLPPAAADVPTLLLDIRYGDQLPDSSRPLGFGFSDGLPVLLMQGGLSFAWWFGPPVPWPVMRDALPGF